MNNTEAYYHAGYNQVKQQVVQRQGDWICIHCNNLNFSFRKRCNRCRMHTKEQNQQLVAYLMGGDWKYQPTLLQDRTSHFENVKDCQSEGSIQKQKQEQNYGYSYNYNYCTQQKQNKAYLVYQYSQQLNPEQVPQEPASTQHQPQSYFTILRHKLSSTQAQTQTAQSEHNSSEHKQSFQNIQALEFGTACVEGSPWGFFMGYEGDFGTGIWTDDDGLIVEECGDFMDSYIEKMVTNIVM